MIPHGYTIELLGPWYFWVGIHSDWPGQLLTSAEDAARDAWADVEERRNWRPKLRFLEPSR